MNDRPQRVVDFRADLTIDGWQPPLIVLTSRPAKAVDPDVVARAYALDGLRFIDGDSFACWEYLLSRNPKKGLDTHHPR